MFLDPPEGYSVPLRIDLELRGQAVEGACELGGVHGRIRGRNGKRELAIGYGRL